MAAMKRTRLLHPFFEYVLTKRGSELLTMSLGNVTLFLGSRHGHVTFGQTKVQEARYYAKLGLKNADRLTSR